MLPHSWNFALGEKKDFSPRSGAKIQSLAHWSHDLFTPGQKSGDGTTSEVSSVSTYPGPGCSASLLTPFSLNHLSTSSSTHLHCVQTSRSQSRVWAPSPSVSPGPLKKNVLGPARPTKPEGLRLGHIGTFTNPVALLVHIKVCELLRKTASLWERGLVWGEIYFHSNNGSLAKGQLRWTSRIYQMPEKEREEK